MTRSMSCSFSGSDVQMKDASNADMRDVEMPDAGRECHRSSSPVDTTTHDQGPPTDNMETGEHRRRVFVIREDGSKEELSLAFATQGGHDIISYKICKDLGLAIEHRTAELGTPAYGQQTTTPITHMARNVRWQFQGSETTYTTDFLVTDYIKFDALVGQATIDMYGLLAPKNMPHYDGPLPA